MKVKKLLFKEATKALEIYETYYIEFGMMSELTQLAKAFYVSYQTIIQALGFDDEWYGIECKIIDGIQEEYEKV